MTQFTAGLRRILAHRRLLAALAAASCVLAICAIATGNHGPAAQVLVATARIPPGSTLTPDQTTQVTIPTNLIPVGAITTFTDTADRITAAAIPSGAILTVDSFVAVSQAESGHVIIPLDVSSQLLGVLSPGDHLSVFLTNLSTGETSVTRGIRVVTIPNADSSGLFSSSGSAGFVLVEAPESIAAQISSAGNMGSVTVAIE